LSKNLVAKRLSLDKSEKTRSKIFTDIAKEISEAAKGTTTRTYNKRHAELAYANLTAPHTLSIQQLAEASKAMNQSAMEKLAHHTLQNMNLNSADVPFFAALTQHEEAVRNIIRASATSIAIQRLIENPEIATWVENGRRIHTLKDGSTCEYCQQELPESRENELAAHFNKSDSNLKHEIERKLATTDAFIEKISKVGSLNGQLFYSELRNDATDLTKALSKEQTKVLEHLEFLREALCEKLVRRTEAYDITMPEFDSTTWDKTTSRLNSTIDKHNSETTAFDQRLKDNFIKIEIHFLSKIATQVKAADATISTLEADIGVCQNGDTKSGKLGINDLENRIKSNRAKISNSHQAAATLSEKLESFLGRNDLKFEPEGDGYRIMRFGRAAKRLSEGEKTAITFLYFVVGLRDQDFEIAEGIVVIDDPISSLDSSSVYQAFSYLQSAVKDARQVFLLTHNFEFLKLLLNWFREGMRAKSIGKTYWMLHCTSTSDTQRETTIKPLDPVLLNNKSEFTYLVKILTEFKSDGTICNSYPIPNIVRKVLETFLAQHSTGDSFYQLLKNLNYDETKKSSLYKYTNDLSHPTLSGLDPALVGETQANVKHMLEMIDKVAPVHYKALTEAIRA
jgi:wobble nucleotide-excising tRNase